MKDKEIMYTGKGLLHQIRDVGTLDYELLLENAQVSVKFTEVHDYSAFTPYEFGAVPKRIIVDGAYAVKVTEHLTSPGAGTMLYFDECVKDIICPDKFYSVRMHLQSTFTIGQVLRGSIGF